MSDLRAPFPWFGGKRRVAPIVWERFGDVRNYVEPFAGSLAVLLGRSTAPRVETVNDANAYLANFWRALAGEHADPDAVAYYADWPVNEADLHARHRWLVESCCERVERIMSDPDYFDAKVAGWWVWGQCLWIGSGWCTPADVSRRGRHQVGGKAHGVHAGEVERKRPVLAHGGGRGVHRHGLDESVSDAVQESATVARKRPLLTGNGQGCGVQKVSLTRQIANLSGDSGAVGRGIAASGFTKRTGGIYVYMRELSERLRRVRVCCGDWSRVVTPAVTTCIGTTGVFLDPPYHAPGTERAVVYTHDDAAIWGAAKDWALANGDNPDLRIALCGYEGDHEIPANWACVPWKAAGGHGRSARGQANRERERIWFSPHCIRPEHQQQTLFAGGAA